MNKVVPLSERRPPVFYTIRIAHYWNDRLEVLVEDVDDNPRSRAAVNDAIARIATSRMTMEHIHKALLDRIDQLMGSKAGTPESAELGYLADACMALEKAHFPMGVSP